jgi:hypothetical protein
MSYCQEIGYSINVSKVRQIAARCLIIFVQFVHGEKGKLFEYFNVYIYKTPIVKKGLLAWGKKII